MASEPVPTSQIVPPDVARARLDVHLAEYEALTMRVTYWITLQYATYAIAAGYLGFVVQAWRVVPSVTLAWASMFVLQLLAWAFLHTTYEIFTNVDYVEKHLKVKIKPLVESGAAYSFWEYEPLLAVRRSKGFLRFEGRFGLLGPFACGMAIAIWLVITGTAGNFWRLSNLAWAAANLYMGGMVVGKSHHATILQREMASLGMSSETDPTASLKA